MFRNYPLFVIPPGLRVFLALLFIWSAIWKGIALWKAGRNGNLGWFVALFVLNTVGILEIIYIFGFSKKQPKPQI
jgi:methionyl-tRNA synthetase